MKTFPLLERACFPYRRHQSSGERLTIVSSFDGSTVFAQRLRPEVEEWLDQFGLWYYCFNYYREQDYSGNVLEPVLLAVPDRRIELLMKLTWG